MYDRKKIRYISETQGGLPRITSTFSRITSKFRVIRNTNFAVSRITDVVTPFGETGSCLAWEYPFTVTQNKNSRRPPLISFPRVPVVSPALK
ncbi:uncharacterized protein LOC117639475 isoform X2 [Thrips palmi]|uniref:Uncharacterized protein LOC117639475 isoform X2 n=1 Tax=Thrips palmi TaxID=161013 RepID=A0A6P8Y4W8_THRPL|nr:uncharacterized protein LOC117639475 isoform X2 [Thrips palmi]